MYMIERTLKLFFLYTASCVHRISAQRMKLLTTLESHRQIGLFIVDIIMVTPLILTNITYIWGGGIFYL